MFLATYNSVEADSSKIEVNSNSYNDKSNFDDPADVLNVDTNDDRLKMTNSLIRMNNDQLNEVIDYVINSNDISNRSTYTFNMTNKLKVAWKAAAQIAINSGYPLAGTLVSYSVDGNDYSEQNGIFSKEIKKTKVYKRIQSGDGSDRFTQSENKDLYYAIHAFNYSNTDNNKLFIKDTFDFAINTDYQNTFSTLINNWGYLNQFIGVLQPIDVNIEIKK